MHIKSPFTQEQNNLGGAMTDISFLLIVFFLITAVFVTEDGLTSNLPEADSKPQLKNVNQVFQIEILNNTEFTINKTLYTDLEQAKNAISTDNAKPIAFVMVNNGVQYGRVVEIISAVKSGGVSEYTIASGTLEDFDKVLVPIVMPDADNTSVLPTSSSPTTAPPQTN